MKTRLPLSLPLLALLAALPTAGVLAQPATPAATPSAPTSPTAAQPDAVAAPAPAATDATLADRPAATDAAAGSATKSKDAAGRDTLSVDFPDEDIRNILRNVADLFELNIIMPDTLQGKTTIKLRDVTWRQIFENVLRPVGYTYVEDGNIIKIVSLESLAQEPTETHVFLVNYARATDILPTISSLVDSGAGGKIVVDSRTNSLVITERPSRMNRIRPIVEQLDRATDQVMIESKFVEVTDSDVKDLGVNWSSLAAYRVGVGGLTGNFDRARGQTRSSGSDGTSTSTSTSSSNSTNNAGTNTTSSQATGSTNSGSVTAAGGAPTSTSTTGITGALNNTTDSTGATTLAETLSTTASSALNGLMSLAETGATNRTANAVFSASDFNLVLSALQTQSKAKIVNNPTIVTLNNSAATINIGEERPIPNYAFNQQTGTYEVNGFTFKPIGVILRVTPQVNARGDIKLTIEPEVSQASGVVDFRGASIPVVETRKASTTVSMRDGYTMGIGGLLQSFSTKGGNKIPVLGNVPILGRLFRTENRNEETSNLIIFITAKTLNAQGAPVEQIFESSRVRQLEMRREDLPGYRDGSNPFIEGPAMPTPLATSRATGANR